MIQRPRGKRTNRGKTKRGERELEEERTKIKEDDQKREKGKQAGKTIHKTHTHDVDVLSASSADRHHRLVRERWPGHFHQALASTTPSPVASMRNVSASTW
jgi:hypothetical protein